jgi:hypothetical protein
MAVGQQGKKKVKIKEFSVWTILTWICHVDLSRGFVTWICHVVSGMVWSGQKLRNQIPQEWLEPKFSDIKKRGIKVFNRKGRTLRPHQCYANWQKFRPQSIEVAA